MAALKTCYMVIAAYIDKPLNLLINYFKKFGHKPCCFDDTHIFITKLLSATDADKVGWPGFFHIFQLCVVLK